MLYIFSSASSDLYRRGVLETCCFPDGHVHRYRYSGRLIPDDLRANPEVLLQQATLLCYAYKTPAASDFAFLPLRHGRIVECGFESGFLYVDIQLGRFVDYDPIGSPKRREEWNATLTARSDRPYPEQLGKKSLFIFEAPPLDGCMIHRAQEAAWQSVVDALAKTPLGDCVTYRVLGFFKVTGLQADLARSMRYVLSKSTSLLPQRFRSHGLLVKTARLLAHVTERRIKAVSRGADCWYRFPMGGTVVLRVLFYRPTELPDPGRELSLQFDSKAFTSASEDKFAIESRYDDIRTILSCVRTADPTYTLLSIRQETEVTNTRIWAAEPSFVVLIGPPKWFLLVTLFLFGSGLFCLNLSATDVLPISTAFLKLHPWIDIVLQHPKPLGTIAVILASWNYLRKFPLK